MDMSASVFKCFETIPDNVKNQLEQVRSIWLNHLGEHIIGIYIHGSLALHCFKPGVSDLDLLIICSQRITKAQRLELAKEIMDVTMNPCPLEMSAICITDLKPWKFPTACQFHYSDYWTDSYLKVIDGSEEKCYILDHDFEDPDIACHVRLTKQSGIRLHGASIDNVFPDVPEEDFWNSLIQDVDNYDFHSFQPRYYASNILNLGRILSYKKEKKILSKYDGALWTLKYIPESYQYIIQNAIDVWYFNGSLIDYGKNDLVGLREFLIREIKNGSL